MKHSNFLPLFMTMMAPQENRDEMLQMTLPSVMPVSPSLKGAISAMAASSITTNHSVTLKREVEKTSLEIATAVREIEKNPDIADDVLERRFPKIKHYKLVGKIRQPLEINCEG